MRELGFGLASIAALFISGWLYGRAAGEPVWRVNMLSYSYYIMSILAFFGAVMLLLGYGPSTSYLWNGDSESGRLAVWAMIVWALIGIPLGAIAVNIALAAARKLRKSMNVYRASRLSPSMDILNDRQLFAFVLLASTVVAVVLIVLMPKETALAHVLASGDVVGGEVVRRQSQYGSGNPIVDGLVNLGTLQILNYVALACALATRRLRWWLLFGLGAVIIAAMDVSKGTVSNILYYLLALGFIRSMMGGAFVKLRELGAVALLVVFLFVTFKGTEGTIVDVLKNAVYHRIVFGQLVGCFLGLEVYPQYHAFIGFSSAARFLHEITGTAFSPSYGIVTMEFYNPLGVAAGSAGHLTTNFMGEAWANFGIVGVIIAPLWVGAFVQLVNRWFITRPKSAVMLAFYAYLTTVFGYARDFIGFYYPAGLITFVLGAFALLYFFKIVVKMAVPPGGRLRSAAVVRGQSV